MLIGVSFLLQLLTTKRPRERGLDKFQKLGLVPHLYTLRPCKRRHGVATPALRAGWVG
jgi:hypothetical protein